MLVFVLAAMHMFGDPRDGGFPFFGNDRRHQVKVGMLWMGLKVFLHRRNCPDVVAPYANTALCYAMDSTNSIDTLDDSIEASQFASMGVAVYNRPWDHIDTGELMRQ